MHKFLEFRFTEVSAHYEEALGMNIEKLLGNGTCLGKSISYAKCVTENANAAMPKLAFLVALLAWPMAHHPIQETRLFF